MASVNQLQPGEKVQVIDPDDGYYLQEGTVEEMRGKVVYVRFPPDDEGQPFRPGQLRGCATRSDADGKPFRLDTFSRAEYATDACV